MEALPVIVVRMIVDGLSAALLVALLLGMAREANRHLPVNRKRLVLMCAIWMHLFCNVLDGLAAFCEGHPSRAAFVLVGASTLLSRLLEIATGVVIMSYIYSDAVGKPLDDQRTSLTVRLLMTINAINGALLLSNGLTHLYYLHTPSNTIVPGERPYLGTMLLLVQSLAMAVVVVRLSPRMRRKTVLRLFVCGVFATTGIVLDLFFPQLSLLNPTMCLVLVLLAIGVQAHLEEDLAHARAETAESRVRLLSGQIHPHFVFNSLAAIKALVSEDPELAETTLQDFSDYLRSHLDEMSTTRLVPFLVELDHVRHYVSLEMADATVPLEVRYELSVDDFMLPPLTVQPLVENAIRHGIRTRESGGVVVVSTLRDEAGVVVTVADDGHGFSSATERQAQRSRVGIANVRERIERQCAGTLEVKSTSAGTVATIRIPEGDER